MTEDGRITTGHNTVESNMLMIQQHSSLEFEDKD
jgi:hypothetical protein